MCGGTPVARTGEFSGNVGPKKTGRFAESGADWRRVFQDSDYEEGRQHRRRDHADGRRFGEKNRRSDRPGGRRVVAISRGEKTDAAMVSHIGGIGMNRGVQLGRDAQRHHPEEPGADDRPNDRDKRIQPGMSG